MAMTMTAIARAAGPAALVPVRTIVDVAGTLAADARQWHRGRSGGLARVRQTTRRHDLGPAMNLRHALSYPDWPARPTAGSGDAGALMRLGTRLCPSVVTYTRARGLYFRVRRISGSRKRQSQALVPAVEHRLSDARLVTRL